MARKYEYVAGRYAWNMEECEEDVLIAAYNEVSRFIPPDQTWKVEFENHFFEHGNGVAFGFLDSINAVRRRRGLDVIAIRETDVHDYARSRDKLLKSNRRRRVRDELINSSVHVREHRTKLALAQAARLPLPHITHDEYKARQQQHRVDSALSLAEITKRMLAQQAASTPQPPTEQKKLPPERAVRMLTLASPEIWHEIIPQLSAEDALDVAEKIENTELRDALVRHSISAS
jgi:hypothetical protein